jgi:hypothetical protein
LIMYASTIVPLWFLTSVTFFYEADGSVFRGYHLNNSEPPTQLVTILRYQCFH